MTYTMIDLFGYRDDLLDAMQDEALEGDGPEAAAAAWRLALAYGKCLLSGVKIGEIQSPLLMKQRIALAMQELERLAALMTDAAKRLDHDWGEAVCTAEADEFAARLLDFRMNLWVVELAIGDHIADEEALIAEDWFSRLNRAAETLDDVLLQQTQILATLSHTNLLENWRNELAPEFRESLPWWLDGTLEKVAQHTIEEADRTMPGPEVWAAIRRIVSGASWVGFPELPLAMAAAGETDEGFFRREWRSPDGTGLAKLVIAPPEEASSPVRLRIKGASGQVVLAGLSADIVEGRATFRFGALKEARDGGQSLSLIVNGIEWSPIEE